MSIATDPNTLWYYRFMLESLRREIDYFNHQIFGATLSFLILMGLGVWASFTPSQKRILLVVIVMGFSCPYIIARADLLMHGAGTWVRMVEEALLDPTGKTSLPPGWEIWKKGLAWRKILLPFLDVMAAFPVIFVFFYALYTFTGRSVPNWMRLENGAFWWTCLAIFLVGCAMIVIAPAVAGKQHLLRKG